MPGPQISVQTAGGSVIAGNFIGTDPTGTLDPSPGTGTAAPGIDISSSPGNTVGGTAPADRNVIAANNGTGIKVVGLTSTANVIAGNLVGLNRAGTAALANRGSGIQVDGGSATVIGGPSAAARNVLSGNVGSGVTLGFGSFDTHDNTVAGNFIGTSAAGGSAVPNTEEGVQIISAHDNTIGGTTSGVRNVISGNGERGVSIAGGSGNLVAGNFIGTTPGGGAALRNLVGIEVSSSPGTTVGGTAGAARNVISGNRDGGVRSASADVSLVGNFIGTTSAGNAPLPNGGDGVLVSAANNKVGDGTAAGRNVISGNAGHGVDITGNGATTAQVSGNRIGSDALGTVAVPNDGDGVRVAAGASGADIGLGPVPVAGAPGGNLISGNGGSGITVSGPGTAGIDIDANAVGTDASGASALPNNDDGVTIRDGAQNTRLGSVDGNLISGNGLSGVFIGDAATTGTSLANEVVGTDGTATAAVPNENGVEVASGAHDNTIAASIISGNRNEGVLVDGSGTTENAVFGNRIGTGVTGATAVPNRQGVVISGGAQLNTIGGTTGKFTNFISGNVAEGVLLTGSGTNRNLIRADFIGTTSSGLAKLANGVGVRIEAGARANTVGGPSTTPTTLVSGNTNAGVEISGAGTRSNRLQGTTIGLDKNAANALGNATGVLVTSGAADTTVGGSSAGAGDVISGNTHSGVEISGATTTGTDVARTRTFLNGGLGINLRPNGEAADVITPNDGGDADNGPNGLQNFPVLTAANGTSGSTTVNGTLNSTPNTQFRIDVFRNPAGTGAAVAEGQNYVGSVTATTDGSGNASFTLTAPADFSAEVFTATATNTSTRNTSELSAARTAT
jgi:hypothetical protein